MRQLPPPLTRAPFTLDDLRSEGRSVERARRSDILHPHYGVHLQRPMPETVASRCHALLPVLKPEHAFSHLTAARLWGMPLPWLPPEIADELHVLAVGARGRVERPGVVSWEIDSSGVGPVGLVAGLTVVSPADVWAQLAGLPERRYQQVDVARLIAIGDFLITGERRERGARRPLCSFEDLIAATDRRRGKRGVKKLALALPRVRRGPDSPKESLLRVALVNAGLPEPEIQVPILTSAGLRHADLGYVKERLLLEYQGDEHRTDRRRWLQDLTRVQLFEDAGFRTILVGDADVYPDSRQLTRRVDRALRAARTE